MSIGAIRTHSVEPASSFRPSCTTRFLSFFTAPRTIGMALGTGAAAIAGCAAPVCLAVGGVVVTVQTIFTKVASGGKVMRSAVFIEADHLSRLDIQGGLPFVTIPPVIDTLETMDTPTTIAAKNSLKGLLEYEEHFDYLGINNHFLVKDLIKKIKQLTPGQIVAIPLSSMDIRASGHIIIGSIECSEDGKFILRIHNGGDGLDFHYTRSEEDSGRRIYQTTLEIADIAMPELINFIKAAASIQAFRLGNNSEKLYKLIPRLKGKVLPASPDSRYWMRKQMGNSCSGYSIKCFLKFVLSPEDYEHFNIRHIALSIKGLQKGFGSQGGFYEKTKEHRIAYNELSAKLIRFGRGDLVEGVRTEDFQPSLAAGMASRVQRKFWGFIFPLGIGSMSGMKLGFDYDDFNRIGKHEYFKELAEAYGKLSHTSHSRDPEAIRALEESMAECREVFKKYIDQIGSTQYSPKELKKLRNIYYDVMHKDSSHQRSLLCQFYEIVFRKQEKALADPGARITMDVINHLKKGDLLQARISLEAAYKLLEGSSEEVTKEQKEEYEFVICQILYNMEDSLTLEDMELRAGLAMFFMRKLRLEKTRDLPTYLTKNMELYIDLRLDRAFSKSSWSRMITDFYAAEIRDHNKHFQLFPANQRSFEPIAGPKLIKLE